MHQSTLTQKAYNYKKKRKHAEAEAKLIAAAKSSRARTAKQFGSVLHEAMMDHWIKVNGGASGKWYTLPRDNLDLQLVGDMLDQTWEALDTAKDGPGSGHEEYPDIGDEGKAPSEDVLIKIILDHPKTKRVMPVAVGAGGRLSNGCAITLHDMSGAGGEDEARLADNSPSIPVSTRNAQCILKGFCGDTESLRCRAMVWTASTKLWTIAGLDEASISADDVREIASRMIEQVSYADTMVAGFTATDAQMPTMRALADEELVIELDERWLLTTNARQRLQSVSSISALGPLFAVRDQLSLGDRTVYELMNALGHAWTWQLWVPKSKRTKRLQDKFEPYVIGGEKLWYSSGLPGRHYLLALLNVGNILGAGMQSLPHN